MTRTLYHSVAFLLGFGFAFLPSYGPFLGLFFFFSNRWTLRRSDLLWWSSALVLALPLLVQGASRDFVLVTLGVLAPWLIYRTFFALYSSRSGTSTATSPWVGAGLLTGLSLVVFLGWLGIDSFDFSYKTIAQAIIWESRQPNLYSHTVLVLGGLMAISLPNFRQRLASLAISALGILVAGSREAAIAWVIIAISLALMGLRKPRRGQLLELGLVSIMLMIAAGLGPTLGWGRVGFLLDLVPSVEGNGNLIQGSEIANGDWWDAMGVRYSTSSVTLGGQHLSVYEVEKTAPEAWRRLQQVVTLVPRTPYTVSFWLHEQPGAGFQGWGPSGDSTFIVTGSLTDGVWQTQLEGAGRILDSGIAAQEGAWSRVWTTFMYEGEQMPLYWWLGLAPQQHEGLGAAAFAGFQLKQQAHLTAYTPGSANRGLGLMVGRVPYWRAATTGFLERPLWGWGKDAFPEYYAQVYLSNPRIQALPSHAHNLPLQILFERGLVGLLGLLLLVIALCASALRKGDAWLLILFAAVGVANIFDYSLFYGGVLYPLAAVAGWRAASYRQGSKESNSKGVSVRLTLVGADFLMTLAAFLSAGLLYRQLGAFLGLGWYFHATTALPYALFLWPLLYWREGLYPGYGLTAAQELRKQVVGAAYAGLIMAAGTFLFQAQLPLPRALLLLTVFLSMALVPIGRALTKRLLYRLKLWGRPVFILGAGETGQRIAQALQKHPLEGLYPVAFFDDDETKAGSRLLGLTVRGTLDKANRYARASGINHAIVAIPRVSPEVLSDLLGHKGRAFRRVQFVPELAGLPAEDVVASKLDGRLALEITNGLRSRRNQLFKRALDFCGSSLGSLAISPILLGIYLWIRFDSPGPALYWSTRIGQHGVPFWCLKFRTMHQDAEAKLQRMLAEDPAVRAEYEQYHKLENDPRITRAGRLLRKYSLDELAQLYNVIKGEMSLVGPRPYLVREEPEMGSAANTILEAKPGMTGYWQVSGRNEVTFGERLSMESHYVRNWSIWWDIVILIETVSAVVARKGH